MVLWWQTKLVSQSVNVLSKAPTMPERVEQSILTGVLARRTAPTRRSTVIAGGDVVAVAPARGQAQSKQVCSELVAAPDETAGANLITSRMEWLRESFHLDLLFGSNVPASGLPGPPAWRVPPLLSRVRRHIA